MTAQNQKKRETPEYPGKSQQDRPEMQKPTPPKPEIPGRGEPGTMPENPANIDHEHEPAGLKPGTDRTKQR